MNLRLISFFRYQFPAFLWAGFIFLASSVPSHRISWFLFHRLDKLIHIGIFFILGLLVYRGLFTWNIPPRFTYKKVWIMLVIVIGYGVLDELHQGFTPGRSIDLMDLTADAAGGLLAGLTAFILRNRPMRINSGGGNISSGD